MRARVGLVVASVAVAIGTSAWAAAIDAPATVGRRAERIAPPVHPDLTPAERAAHDLVDLVNDERTRRGLPLLLWDDRVAAAAAVHSADMAARRALVHAGVDGSDTGDRLDEVSFPWRSWGEAIGAGDETPLPLFEAWMDSPDHRRHLLSDHRVVGVGVAVTGDVVDWTLVVAT